MFNLFADGHLLCIEVSEVLKNVVDSCVVYFDLKLN